jgi:hypothetical protein
VTVVNLESLDSRWAPARLTDTALVGDDLVDVVGVRAVCLEQFAGLVSARTIAVEIGLGPRPLVLRGAEAAVTPRLALCTLARGTLRASATPHLLQSRSDTVLGLLKLRGATRPSCSALQQYSCRMHGATRSHVAAVPGADPLLSAWRARCTARRPSGHGRAAVSCSSATPTRHLLHGRASPLHPEGAFVLDSVMLRARRTVTRNRLISRRNRRVDDPDHLLGWCTRPPMSRGPGSAGSRRCSRPTT